jgi:hypothetical protein
MANVTCISGRICDKAMSCDAPPTQQREIADLAYKFWLARNFHNGSPQEDWLRAQRMVRQSRLRA